MDFEEWVGTQADIYSAHPHVDTEQEEVAVVVVTHTIVQPGCSP